MEGVSKQSTAVHYPSKDHETTRCDADNHPRIPHLTQYNPFQISMKTHDKIATPRPLSRLHPSPATADIDDNSEV